MFNMHTTLSGRYQCSIRRGDGSSEEYYVEETPFADNIITDVGLRYLGGTNNVRYTSGTYAGMIQQVGQLGTSFAAYGYIGTGADEPAASNTAMTSRVATVQISSYGALARPDSETHIVSGKYVYAQGAVVGNMTEIGVGWVNADNTTSVPYLFSRALIRDSNGAATALTVTAIDQLTVTYYLTYKVTTAIATSSAVIGGVTYQTQAALLGYGGNALPPTGGMYSVPFAPFGGSSEFRFMQITNPGFPANRATTPALSGALVASSSASYANWSSELTAAEGQYNILLHDYDSQYFHRDFSLYIPTGSANAVGPSETGFNAIMWYVFSTTWTMQAIIFDKIVPKDATKQMSLTFRISWGRA